MRLFVSLTHGEHWTLLWLYGMGVPGILRDSVQDVGEVEALIATYRRIMAVRAAEMRSVNPTDRSHARVRMVVRLASTGRLVAFSEFRWVVDRFVDSGLHWVANTLNSRT
ncbi:hypothetical protein ABT160_23695 [Streptomyces sp. NPDC001941]|uniref:hypothetical protein n=1 Tax=Streptomyces sp. NPDC001941 TaxID=3154659 RepID=UPI00332C3541